MSDLSHFATNIEVYIYCDTDLILILKHLNCTYKIVGCV